MRIQKLIFFLYGFNLQILFIVGNWREQLTDYDVLPNLNIRIPKSASNKRKISFTTKFRIFNLILKPSDNLFTNDFKSVNLDKNGKETIVFIDVSQYYQGFVSDVAKSSVRAYLGNSKEISINIIMNDEIFQVESLSRYDTSNSSILVYRLSDVKIHNTKNSLFRTKRFKEKYYNNTNHSFKRSVNSEESILSPISTINSKKYCTIKLVADYRFHMEHGKGDQTRTHNYLIELMDNINQLFKNTEFIDANNNKYIGYGFLIRDIVVYEDWSEGIRSHFNQRTPLLNFDDLLISFGDIDHGDYCLAHLFTYQNFNESILGLAYMGTSTSLNDGGICSGKRDHLSVNTAWSSYKDSNGGHLISMTAYLVTAHELGHNWGSDHDPDTPYCSPNSDNGGKYIMHAFSMTEYDKNYRTFSPCSRKAIGETIAKRHKNCFKMIDKSYCGNSRVEEGEQCDLGRNNLNDLCCTPDCHFRTGMVCSPYNHECCTQSCQLKAQNEICSKADPLNPCLGDAKCDGTSQYCPSPKPLSGPNCTENGRCMNGKCRPFCERLDMEACICDQLEKTCLICCRNKSRNNKVYPCQPAIKSEDKDNQSLKLNDGRPCAQGFCENGICKRKVNKLVERIWKIIDNFNTNLFVSFLLDNLVGAIIIATLLLWIPSSIMVSCNDAKHRKNFLKERGLRRQLSIPGLFVASSNNQ